MNDSYLTDFSSSEENHFSNLINNNKKVKQSNNEMLVISISLILENIIQQNKKMKNYKKIIKSQKQFSFFDDEKPDISIKDYLNRINCYCKPEESTFIISLIIIDRLCCESKIILNDFNIHRILFSSVLISIKFNEDKSFDHKYYSSVAGISMLELKVLEMDFLKLINYNVFISKEIFEKYCYYLNETLKY
jgi:hypothetical protein